MPHVNINVNSFINMKTHAANVQKGNDDDITKKNSNGFRAFNIKHPPRGNLATMATAAETEN